MRTARDPVAIVGNARSRVSPARMTPARARVLALLEDGMTRGKGEAARHHPHDCIGLAVERHRSTQNRLVASIKILPEAIAENDFLPVSHFLFFVSKSTSNFWRNSEHVEKVPGHALTEHDVLLDLVAEPP